MKINKIYNENCLDTMARMPDNFIDLTVTSPPYDNLRTYNDNIDESWGEHVWKPIIKELYRVTKDGGVVVWVVGDATINGSETGTSFRQALYAMDCGFNLHDTMIYQKNGPAYPANDKSNRYSQIFEYMFVFSKEIPKKTNLIKDRKNRWGGSKTFGTVSERTKDGQLKKRKQVTVSEIGYRYNVWKINSGFGYSSHDNVAHAHPAIFPEKLAYDHIISWSDRGDLVYDPFIGSGTTAKAAICANRKWLGSEISKEYCDIANKRLEPLLNNLFT